MSEWVTWLLGGGMATVGGLALKLARDLNTLRVEQAKTSAQAAEFKADEAGSSTKVAGEDIFKGLMRTIVQREQEAHQMTAMVQQQLVEERRINADARERYAVMAEKEEFYLRANGQLLIQLRELVETHRIELGVFRTRLKVATQQRLALGGKFSATEIVGDDFKPGPEP